VLPRGRNFGRKTQKGPIKNLRGRETRGRIFTRFAKNGPKRGRTFSELISGIICGFSEINAFLSQIFPHILLQFVSFHLIFSSRNNFSSGAEFFYLAAELFHRSSRKFFERVGNTDPRYGTGYIADVQSMAHLPRWCCHDIFGRFNERYDVWSGGIWRNLYLFFYKLYIWTT
jgi:hypothetical protein